MVGAGFSSDGGGERASDSSVGWALLTHDGDLYHAGGDSSWEGQPDELKEGDVLVRQPSSASLMTRLTSCVAVQGLLLDLDAATLTVWVNGERKGVMARPGMTDHRGQPVARLEGPLRWAIDVYRDTCSVSIDGPLPPPLGATAAAAAQ